MRALIIDGDVCTFNLRHPDPVPERGEAIVRARRSVLTRADLDLARTRAPGPFVPGRAFAGVVESVGPDTDDGLVGRRIVVDPASRCRTCDRCLQGLGDHCRNRRLLGTSECPGSLADLVRLPLGALHEVPDGVEDDRAAFAAPVAAALQTVRQITVESRPFITVLGDGLIGLLCVQVMASLNASVRLVGGSSDRLAVCEKWGVKHRHVDDVGRRADQDVVVECTGTATGLELALQYVRPRGTVVLKQLPVVNGTAPGLERIHLDEVVLLGSAAGSIPAALQALEHEDVDVVSLVGRRMRLDDGEAIVRAASDPAAVVMIQ